MSGRVPGIMIVCALLAAWAPPASTQSPELPPEWEVRTQLAELVKQVQRFEPILDEVKPAEWVEKGAPEAYERQWQSVRAEIEFLSRGVEELSQEPERLTVALEALLRMQSLDSLLLSLNEGVRRYQNPALAELLQGAITEKSAHQLKLREYVVQLAAAKEEELKVMHQEAQRCRAQATGQTQRR